MRSGLITSIGLRVIHVDFYRIWFLAVVEAPWVNRRFTGSPRRGPWGLNFFEGLYMYTYTEPTNHIDPPHPHCYCTSVHPCTFVHYCTLVHYCTFVHYRWDKQCPMGLDKQCLRWWDKQCLRWVFIFFCEEVMHSPGTYSTGTYSPGYCSPGRYSPGYCSTGYWIAYSGMLWRAKVFELFSSIYLTAFVLVYSK